MRLGRGLVGSTDAVPDGRVLSVVVAEVHVVNGVVASAVQERATKVDLVVDADGPYVDAEEHCQEQPVVNREQIDGDVVRDPLTEPVHRVERVAAVRRGVAVRVVGLVDQFVNKWMVQATVRPVHQAVGEGKEGAETEDEVNPTILVNVLVDFAVATEG